MEQIRDILKNRLNTFDYVLCILFFIFSIFFIITIIPLHPYRGSFVIKAIPVTSLGVLVLKNIRSVQGKILFAGALFSAAGDVALDLDRVNYFLWGLSFFFIAHLFYTAAFIKDFLFEKRKIVPALGVLVFAAVMAFLLKDIEEKMFVPVMLYLGIIMVMTLSALFMNTTKYVIFAGAALFMVSDAIIAVNKFVSPIPHSSFFNITVYFSAQLLIVSGFLMEKIDTKN